MVRTGEQTQAIENQMFELNEQQLEHEELLKELDSRPSFRIEKDDHSDNTSRMKFAPDFTKKVELEKVVHMLRKNKKTLSILQRSLERDFITLFSEFMY